MSDIVLATLNAKFIHAAFGLRCLLANLGPLRPRATLLEFDIQQRPLEIAETLLRQDPRILGLGVYLWNTAESLALAGVLKRLRPDLILVLGGPEISHEIESQPLADLADYILPGEADLAFAELCQQLLAGERPAERIRPTALPDLARLQFPYNDYTDDDLRHRVVYVEASRGCPFHCEFCLSSLDLPVRQFPLESFLAEMDRLLQRGLRQFKFVDRTFNLRPQISRAILEFFLDRLRPGLFLHFEMIPDRLPPDLRDLITRFPPGTLQFEVGIQTFNPQVAERIQRRQDLTRTEDNLRFLRDATHVHIHADLIAGLPGEDLDSIARGFDRLLALRPHEIQLGILKRLRGTPIARHDAEWQMVYRPDPPYEVLRHRTLDFTSLQRLRRFARAWDLVVNSGRFPHTAPRLWSQAPSPFVAFLEWTDWLFADLGPLHGIALNRLAEALFRYLTSQRAQPVPDVAAALTADLQHDGRKGLPAFLAPTPNPQPTAAVPRPPRSTRRQARHQSAAN